MHQRAMLLLAIRLGGLQRTPHLELELDVTSRLNAAGDATSDRLELELDRWLLHLGAKAAPSKSSLYPALVGLLLALARGWACALMRLRTRLGEEGPVVAAERAPEGCDCAIDVQQLGLNGSHRLGRRSFLALAFPCTLALKVLEVVLVRTLQLGLRGTPAAAGLQSSGVYLARIKLLFPERSQRRCTYDAAHTQPKELSKADACPAAVGIVYVLAIVEGVDAC
eukprot:7003492-Prymnesium_polylepis.1